MSDTQEFQVFSWLSSYLQTPINRDEIQQVLNFCLMWNLFESKVFDCSADPNKIKDAVANLSSDKKLHVTAFENSLEYFRSRYFANGQESQRYADLKFRANDSEPLVRNVLDGSSSEPTEVIQCLLLVVWRLRNNLFHGMKGLSHLTGQNENFEHANNVLARFLEIHSPA